MERVNGEFQLYGPFSSTEVMRHPVYDLKQFKLHGLRFEQGVSYHLSTPVMDGLTCEITSFSTISFIRGATEGDQMLRTIMLQTPGGEGHEFSPRDISVNRVSFEILS